MIVPECRLHRLGLLECLGTPAHGTGSGQPTPVTQLCRGQTSHHSVPAPLSLLPGALRARPAFSTCAGPFHFSLSGERRFSGVGTGHTIALL